jgi:hypothetical protein
MSDDPKAKEFSAGRTAIHPCRLCPLREGCEQREKFRALARGSQAVSITYRCPILAKEIRVGRRVGINAPYIDLLNIGYQYNRSECDVRVGNREVYATITSVRRDHSFAATVDFGALGSVEDGGIGVNTKDPNALRFRRTQKHHRILRFLDDPDEPLCKMCGSRIRDGQCDRRDGMNANCMEPQTFHFEPFDVDGEPF